MKKSKIEYAYVDNHHVFRMHGEVRYVDVTPLMSFIESIKENLSPYVIDLSQTEMLDSTALGVLASISTISKDNSLVEPVIYVSNINIREILEGVCFDQIFTIKTGAEKRFLTADNFDTLVGRQLELTELKETVQQAHKNLAEINEKNLEHFQDVNDLIRNIQEVSNG